MFVLALVLASVAGGTAATFLWDDESPFAARLATGTCVGLTSLGLIGFLLALFFGFSALTLAAAASVTAAPLGLLTRPCWRARLSQSVHRPAISSVVLLVVFCLPLAMILSRAMFTEADGVYTGIFVNRNDLPLHIAIVQGFLEGGNLPPQHPEFAGARLTYPFLADYIAAQLAFAGASIERAMAMENLVLLPALVVLLYHWAWTLTRNRAAALSTPVIVLAGSGLGWMLMLRDYQASGTDFASFIASLPRDYTINTSGLRWGNLITTMLVSQRSFLLGLPLFIIVWTAWWRAVAADVRADRAVRLMAGAGAIAGMIPLAHPHSFAVLMTMGVVLAFLFPRPRAWALFFVAALMLAIPQLWWVSRGSMVNSAQFIGWHVGWTKGPDSLWWFWLKNTGLFIPLLAVALAARHPSRIVSPALVRFYVPFLICFIVPQLLKLAPRASGNIKVLVYWYIASAPLVALLLARWWHRSAMHRAAAVSLLASLTFSTALDGWRVLTGASTVRVFDAQSVAFAKQVQRATPPGAVILHAPSRNHPVFLTGRLSLLGNLSHVASHGFDYTEREAQVRRIYAGGPDAAELLVRHGVDYIVIGPQERLAMQIDEHFLARYPATVQIGRFSLHEIAAAQPPIKSATRAAGLPERARGVGSCQSPSEPRSLRTSGAPRTASLEGRRPSR